MTRDEWHLSILLTQLLSAVRDVIEVLGTLDDSPLPSHVIGVVCEAELAALQVSLCDETAGAEVLLETITSLAAASELVFESFVELDDGPSAICGPLRRLHGRVANAEIALARFIPEPESMPLLSADNAKRA